MSDRNIKRQLGLLASAMAMSAIASLVAAPGSAHAQSKPPCGQYSFPSNFSISHGYHQIFFYETKEGQTETSSRVYALGPNGELGGRIRGEGMGSVKGHRVELIIRWGDKKSAYTGVVGAGGTRTDYTVGTVNSAGSTYNPAMPHGTTWSSYSNFKCVVPPTSAPPSASTGPGKKIGKSPLFAKVINEDVDVYDRPNEDDANNPAKKLGILRKDSQVVAERPCEPSAWCEVSGKAVPGGRGWIWGHLQFS